MKFIILFILSLHFIACHTQVPKQEVVAEKPHLYMDQNLYEQFKTQIPDFPKSGSAEQAADEKELRKIQKSRTQKDCERAVSEVTVTLQSTYGKPYGQLNADQVNVLIPFFDQIRHDAGPYIGQIKKGYTRLRPYDYLEDLSPCISREKSFAYPSGHATLATLYSLVLMDLFPKNKVNLKKRAEQIGHDRILGGVHHPTDIAAGKKLGSLLYTELKKSKIFNDDLEKYKKLLN